MMTKAFDSIGFYWQPLGGNNIDQISGHCYCYTDVVKCGRQSEKTSIIVDVGKFDNHQALGIKNSAAAVPDIRNLLESDKDRALAVFITHSHPDHLNGIPHYLKAGYVFPPLYAGKYTFMILYDLLKEYQIPRSRWPKFNVINDGDVINIGSLEIEVLASSHTCFDSFGLIIKSKSATVYHSGDMKVDQSTCFRRPTNLKRLKERAGEIDYVVGDFYGIYSDGMAVKEVDTYRKLVSLIKKMQKPKVFIPVYPTHPEMYLIAFMAALKLKKNVIFYGNPDFFTYLKMIIEYGISFEKLAGKRIKISYAHNREDVAEMDNNYAVIGTFNDIPDVFEASHKDSFGIITASTYFNPLKGRLNSYNIRFVSVNDYPELQGYGHGFLGDWEYVNNLLSGRAVFIPTHCPVFMIDDFRQLAKCCGLKLISQTPQNNQIYQLSKKDAQLVSGFPAKWLVVLYNGDDMAYFSEVFQKPTSGTGFLKRTISRKRCRRRFKIYMAQRYRKQHKQN